MRTDLVIKAMATFAGLVVTVVGTVLIVPATAGRSNDATEVGGVTMTVPGADSTDDLGLSFADKTTPAGSRAPAPAKQPGGGGGGGNTGGSKPGGGAVPLEATGSVAGLYPGHREYLPLKLENSNSFAVSVVDMSITVAPSGRCSASNIALPQGWAAQDIARNSERTIFVPIEMVASATNDCAGKTFGLTYSGKAVKA